MPFPAFFRSTPAPAPVPFKKPNIIRPKTVADIMGENFDFVGAIGLNTSFSKKMLKWAAKEFSTENISFLLVCEKFKANPTRTYFELIYQDYIVLGGVYQANISSDQRTAITTVRQALPTGFTAVRSDVFDRAVGEIHKLLKADPLKRLRRDNFDEAFLAKSPAVLEEYNKAITYLNRHHQITLM
jgi:hypothetical protein